MKPHSSYSLLWSEVGGHGELQEQEAEAISSLGDQNLLSLFYLGGLLQLAEVSCASLLNFLSSVVALCFDCPSSLCRCGVVRWRCCVFEENDRGSLS